MAKRGNCRVCGERPSSSPECPRCGSNGVSLFYSNAMTVEEAAKFVQALPSFYSRELRSSVAVFRQESGETWALSLVQVQVGCRLLDRPYRREDEGGWALILRDDCLLAVNRPEEVDLPAMLARRRWRVRPDTWLRSETWRKGETFYPLARVEAADGEDEDFFLCLRLGSSSGLCVVSRGGAWTYRLGPTRVLERRDLFFRSLVAREIQARAEELRDQFPRILELFAWSLTAGE